MFEHGVGIKNPLFFIGVVENNVDPRREGRVQVRAFGIHGTNKQVPRDELPWAIVVKGDYDPNGAPGLGLPAINAWVFGAFLDGRDAQQPMVLGLIPTQYTEGVDPDKNGWGYIPDTSDAELLARGSDPESFGEPNNSRLARGENIQETHVHQHQASRVQNIKIGGYEGRTWSEPGSAYNAEYPHNRVIQSGSHSIELDDTPNAERITIWHKSGSYVQIDNKGATTHKSTNDKYEVNDRNQHVVVGGMSTVTINGNSYVYVKGNKIEEIEGDLQTLVHGNHLLSVGGQSTINASEQVQVRGADVKVEANVGTMSVKAGKEINVSSGLTGGLNYGAISIKSEKILVDATDKLHLRGNTQVNIQAIAEMNLSALAINQLSTTWASKSTVSHSMYSGLTTDIGGGIDVAIGGGIQTNINSPIVNIDTFVNLAGGLSRPNVASATTTAATARVLTPPTNQIAFTPGSQSPEIAWGASSIEAPEPTSKSTSIVVEDPQSQASTGYAAVRPRAENTAASVSNVTTVMNTAAAPLLDFIGNKESDGYDDISGLVSQSRYPSKPLTQMTIQEVLDWQESIDSFQGSEASGRYQIMEDTLRGYNNDRSSGPGNPLYARAGLSAGDLFSPENQDKMAVVLLEGRGLSRFLNGEITREQFANNLANEWASLPLVNGPNAGRSVYAGDSVGNRALTTVQEFLDAIDAVKAKEQAIISGGAG